MTADRASMLPTGEGEDEHNLLVAGDIEITLQPDARTFALEAGSFTLTVDDILEIAGQAVDESPAITMTIAEGQPADAVVATVASGAIHLNAFKQENGEPYALGLTGLTIRRNGFTLDEAVTTNNDPVTIDSLLKISSGMTLTVSSLAMLDGSLTGGTIAWTTPVDAELFPDLWGEDEGLVALTGTTGSLNVVTGAFTFAADEIEARLADLIIVKAEGVALGFDPAHPENVLFKVADVSAEINGLPPLPGLPDNFPTVDFGTFGMTGNGRFILDQISVDLHGYQNSFNLGGLLPVRVEGIRVLFPEADGSVADPDHSGTSLPTFIHPGLFDLEVEAHFDFEQLAAAGFGLPGVNLPEIIIGGSSDDPDSGDHYTSESDLFSFKLNLARLRQGLIRPVNIDPIRLRFAEMESEATPFADQFTLQGEIFLGRIDADGGIANLVNPSLPDLDANAGGWVEITHTAPGLEQYQNLRADLSGRLTFADGNHAVLNLQGSLSTNPQGDIAEEVALDFGLRVETDTTPFSMNATPTVKRLSATDIAPSTATTRTGAAPPWTGCWFTMTILRLFFPKT